MLPTIVRCLCLIDLKIDKFQVPGFWESAFEILAAKLQNNVSMREPMKTNLGTTSNLLKLVALKKDEVNDQLVKRLYKIITRGCWPLPDESLLDEWQALFITQINEIPQNFRRIKFNTLVVQIYNSCATLGEENTKLWQEFDEIILRLLGHLDIELIAVVCDVIWIRSKAGYQFDQRHTAGLI